MASVSASHLIIFVASLVVAAGVVGTLTAGVERVSSSIDDGSIDVSQQIKMDMAIISDPGAEYNDDDEELTIYVRNTGSQGVPIEASQFDVVFNNQFVTNDNIEVSDANGDDTTWRPNGVVNVTVTDHEIQSGDNRLLLTVNSDEETFEFNAD